MHINFQVMGLELMHDDERHVIITYEYISPEVYHTGKFIVPKEDAPRIGQVMTARFT